MKGDTTYYLIVGFVVGKKVEDKIYHKDYLFREGKWIPDTDHLIMDRLVGYDAYEPEDSYYKMGNMSIMDELDEISEDTAKQLMSKQTANYLKKKWSKELIPEKEKWDESPMWSAKCVETTFRLYGIDYSIRPIDIGLTYDGWEQGFMECFQETMDKDLKEYGAENIRHFGFID